MALDVATSGISGLDAQLGGGFPRGATVLVLGDPCNALSVLAEQFCAGGLAHGEQVLYFQFDRPARGARERIGALGQELGSQKGQLRVFDGYSAQFGAVNGNGHGATQGVEHLKGMDTMAADVLNEAMKAGAQRYRLALDSISALARPGREGELVDFFRNLVHVGHETRALQMVTLVRGLLEPPVEARLKHLATGVLELGIERKGFGLYNFLQVTKMLDLPDPTRLVLFKETEKGLWMESTKRVF